MSKIDKKNILGCCIDYGDKLLCTTPLESQSLTDGWCTVSYLTIC